MKQLYLFSAEPTESDRIHAKIPTHWKVYIDGASRNNPGPAGAGAVIYKNGKVFEKHGFFLGTRTNNQAEYGALLVGLYFVKKHYQLHDHIDIISDSQLLVKQFKGEYRIKHPELRPLHQLAKELLVGILFTFTHIMREKNTEADELANEGIDKHRKLPSDFLLLLKNHDISW